MTPNAKGSKLPAESERLLTAAQVAVAINRSINSIYSLMKKGVLPPPRAIGARCAMWLQSEIDEALHALPVRGRPKKVKRNCGTKNTSKATKCEKLSMGGTK